VDQIIVLKDGEITETGSYKELLTQKGAFAEFLLQHLEESGGDEEILDGNKNKFSFKINQDFNFKYFLLLLRRVGRDQVAIGKHLGQGRGDPTNIPPAFAILRESNE
jgi:hypothetical protein